MNVTKLYGSRRHFLKTAAFTVASAAGAASMANVARAKSQTGEIQRVGIIPACSFGMYYLVQDQRFAPGVRMKFRMFQSGPPAIEAMVGGSLDVVTVGSMPTLAPMYHKVADCRIITICGDASSLYTIVGQPDVKTLADLEGRKIAVPSGTAFELFLNVVLKAKGLENMPLTRIDMGPMDAQTAFIAGAVDATLPLATSKQLIFERKPDTSMVVDGATLAVDERPRILDVLMTTRQYIDSNEVGLVASVGAMHDKVFGMLRDDKKALIARMVAWQQASGFASVTAADITPIVDGYTYFDTREIKDAYQQGILNHALKQQAEFMIAHGRLGGMPDIDTLVSDRIVTKI